MKYKAGDKVRIKSWERMENEYGLDLLDDIPCKHVFTQEMVGWCERVMTIDSINVDNYDGDGYNMKEDYGEYFWSDDMIEGLVESSSEKRSNASVLTQIAKVPEEASYIRYLVIFDLDDYKEMVGRSFKEALMNYTRTIACENAISIIEKMFIGFEDNDVEGIVRAYNYIYSSIEKVYVISEQIF